MRKLVMTSMIIYVFSRTPAQVGAGLAVSLFALVMTAISRPFANRRLSTLQIYALSAHACTLFCKSAPCLPVCYPWGMSFWRQKLTCKLLGPQMG